MTMPAPPSVTVKPSFQILHVNAVTCLAFAPEGAAAGKPTLLATGSRDRSVMLHLLLVRPLLTANCSLPYVTHLPERGRGGGDGKTR